MKFLLVALILSGLSLPAFSYTFVMKSGKHIEGVLLYEEESVLRIRDGTGIEMSLKKSSLDFDAMRIANPPRPLKPAEQTVAPVGGAEHSKRRPVRVFTNEKKTTVETISFSGLSEKELREKIRTVERSYNRLKAECRNAGTGPTVKKNLETHFYKVNGKTVRVTGYWAHAESVKQAKMTCQKAIEAEATLIAGREALQELETPTGSGSPAGLP